MTQTPELFGGRLGSTITINSPDGPREVDIYSEEGFVALANLFTRSGWQHRISYEPTWLGIPIIQTPEVAKKPVGPLALSIDCRPRNGVIR